MNEARQLAYNRLNEVRNVEYLVKSPEFQATWDGAIEGARAIVLIHIKNGDKNEVQKWLDHHRKVAHAEKKWTVLMNHAKKCGVKNYSRMSRAQLIAALESYDRRKDEANS
jgi:hypothetical protein